jgi:pimeloyl-ACP methyl ester carboxylesterase
MSFFTRAHLTDLRGYGRLAADAGVGITNLVESLHQTITRVADPTGVSRRVSPIVYFAIRGGARLAGRGIDAALASLAPMIPEGTPTVRQEALRAAINGVYGDHLASTGNPLAVPMRLRRDGRPLTWTREKLAAAIPDAGSRVLVLVHGLCTNDLRWRRGGHDHGTALARDLGYTPIYLHYNSGRNVADNGAEFAGQLETLAAQWPVVLDELTIVGHSMGGLVARSAVQAARGEQLAWPKRLRRLVFLGTPHHGALLEQLGSWVEAALHASRYSAPFARLGAARSAGITDLRHGSDVALPAGIECFAIAATLGVRARPVLDQLLGDGLVPLDSALGRHPNAAKALAFPPERQWIARRTRHLDLMGHAEVYARLREWLAA